MINEALQFIVQALNQALRNNFQSDENLVVMNNVIQADGTIPLINQNKIVLSLINIEKETNKPFNTYNQPLETGNYSSGSPSEYYNLDILFSSNFDDYGESLKMLSATIAYFQGHTSLTSSDLSTMPGGIKKLDLDVEKLIFHQMHSLWTAMGAKYQPSILYKVRLLNIQSGQIRGTVSAITQTANQIMHEN